MKTGIHDEAARASGADVDLKRRRLLQATGGAFASGLTLSALPTPADATAPADAVDARELSALQRSIRGTVVRRGTPVYEAWRQSMVWNYRKFRRFPGLIVQADSEDDVVATVNFARRNKLRLTTRSGGHSWSGCFLRDGGVLLDLSRLQSVEIDTQTREAKVQPGVIGRILNARLGAVGLAFPTAHCGMVPISGFLLGGGLGLNSTAWGGMSVFSIMALDIVTADGERRHASPDENSELFWAARGAGPGLFFTVTRFYLRCYPLPGAITTSYYTFQFSELMTAVELMDDAGPTMDPALELLTVVVPAPDDSAARCSRDDCGRVVVMSAIAFADTERQAKSMLAPIANHGAARAALRKIEGRPTPFEVLYQDNEGPFPQRRARADNIYTDRAREATRVLSRHMPQAPSAGNTPVILWRGDQPFPDAAYSARGRYYYAGYAQWDAAADDLANQAWLKSLYDDMQPLASGFYINEFDRETRAAQTSRCFAEPNWIRLQGLRKKYDPEGVFHDFLGV